MVPLFVPNLSPSIGSEFYLNITCMLKHPNPTPIFFWTTTFDPITISSTHDRHRRSNATGACHARTYDPDLDPDTDYRYGLVCCAAFVLERSAETARRLFDVDYATLPSMKRTLRCTVESGQLKLPTTERYPHEEQNMYDSIVDATHNVCLDHCVRPYHKLPDPRQTPSRQRTRNIPR